MNFFKKSAVLLLFFDSNTAFYLGIRDSIPNKICALSDKVRILQINISFTKNKEGWLCSKYAKKKHNRTRMIHWWYTLIYSWYTLIRCWYIHDTLMIRCWYIDDRAVSNKKSWASPVLLPAWIYLFFVCSLFNEVFKWKTFFPMFPYHV